MRALLRLIEQRRRLVGDKSRISVQGVLATLILGLAAFLRMALIICVPSASQ